MPPKKSKSPVKKKKKAEKKEEAPFPVPRDLSEACPIDAHDGLLGLEHGDVKGRVRAVNLDVVLWKISEAVRGGELEVDLADHGLEELPDELFELPWIQVLDLSKNVFVNGAWCKLHALDCYLLPARVPPYRTFAPETPLPAHADVFEDLPLLPSLKAVDLSTNLLHGPLPVYLGSFPPTLEELCLDGNVISEIPEAAAALSQLAWLSLKKNVLTSLPPACLKAWVRLEYLDLRHNKLTMLPDEIGECRELRTLFLSNNALPALPETLGSCTALTLLHVSRNSLKLLPESLGSCTFLEELDVSFNKLEGLSEAVFAGLTSLRKLLAAANKIDAVPATLALAANLEVISLSS